MTTPVERPMLRVDRIRIRVAVAWSAAALSVLVMVLLAVIAITPASRLTADRERTYQRHATVITENLAASLISPDQTALGSQRADALIVASPAALEMLLKAYRQLASISVVSSVGEVVAAAGVATADSAQQIQALRTLPAEQFPPKGDDIATITLSGQTITAGRILEGPGRGGPLLILAFSTEDPAQTTRVLLFALSGATLFALLIWVTLDQLLTRLVFAPHLAIRRFQNSARRGNWMSRLHLEGSREIQRYAAHHNFALDRAARLWDTINWRRRYLERHAAEKSAEAAELTEGLSRRYRFGTQITALPSAPRRASFIPMGLLLLIEFAALLALMSALGEAATWLAVPFPWRMAALLGCTGLGWWLGSNVSVPPQKRRAYLLKLAGLSFVCAAAYLSAASFITSIAGVALPRVGSGFCIAVTFNMWMQQTVSTEIPALSTIRNALTRVIFIALFVASLPVILYAVMTHSPVEILTIASVAALLVAATALLALLSGSEDVAFASSRQVLPQAPSLLVQLVLSVSVLAISFAYLVSILIIDFDDSGRYLSLSMFLVALVTGISLPFSLGAKAVWVAMLAGAACGAPSLVLHYLFNATDAVLVSIMLGPAIATIAGSSVAWTALTVPERATTSSARSGDPRQVFPRQRFVIQSVGLSLMVSGLAGVTAVSASSYFPIATAMFVSVIAALASRLRRPAGGGR